MPGVINKKGSTTLSDIGRISPLTLVDTAGIVVTHSSVDNSESGKPKFGEKRLATTGKKVP